MSLPLQNEAYVFYVALSAQADPSTFVTDPTIAAGDFTVSIDGGGFSNLTTLPVVEPAGGILVRVDLSALEMAGEKINVFAQDAAGDEWAEALIGLDLPVANSETLFAIENGDRIETSTRLIVNEEGTSTAIIDKTITGSLLSSSVTLTTVDT